MLKMIAPNLIRKLKANSCLVVVFSKYATLNSAVDIKHLRDPEWDQALPYAKIPGPKTLKDIREFFPGGKFSNIPMNEFHRRLNQQYGNIVLIKGILRQPNFVITYDPNDFEKLHRTEGHWPIRNGMEVFSHYRNEIKPEFYKETGGLVAEQGERWAKFRNRVNPVMMQPKNVKQYVPEIDQIATEFTEKIRLERNASNVMSDNFGYDIFKWALESIAAIALDKRLMLLSRKPNPDGIALIDSVRLFFELSYKLEYEPSLWRYFPTPLYKKQIANLDRLTATVSKILDEAVENINKQETIDGEESILKKLLKIDRSTAYVMAADMIIAGADTTGSLTTSILFLLAKNPDKQQKLREEVLGYLPDKKSVLKVDSLRNIPYLRAVIKETARMQTVAIGNLREAGQDLVLQNYQVPKGTNVLTGNILTHFDEKQYSNPHSFIPERWLKSTTDFPNKTAHPFSFLPFGFGVRTCIGRRFAELEMECIVSRLVRNYYIGWNGKEDLKYKSDFINSPTGPVPFTFKDLEK